MEGEEVKCKYDGYVNLIYLGQTCQGFFIELVEQEESPL